MQISWDDLTTEEQDAVGRLYRSFYATLTDEMADRFMRLGLAEQKLGGVGISAEGRRLYVSQMRRTNTNRIAS